MRFSIQKVVGLLFVALNVSALDHFSVSKGEIKAFAMQCVKTLDKKTLTQDIYQLLVTQRAAQDKNFYSKIKKSVLGFGKVKTSEVNFDGLHLKNIHPVDLEIINTLTIHRDAQFDVLKSSYPLEKEVVGNTTYYKRKCESYTCKSRNLSNAFSLDKYSQAGTCKESLCASKMIFGETKGAKILYAYLKYGIVLSSFSDVNADPEGFDEETLDAILGALSMVPEHLKATVTENFGFYRFQKGSTLAIYGKNSNVIANAYGSVFDAIDDYSFEEKIYIFIHELGHRSSRYNSQKLDDSEEWKQLSQIASPVSAYAKTNASEDFAETYALYRINPLVLMKISPAKYNFMKNKVFAGKEYVADLCKASH